MKQPSPKELFQSDKQAVEDLAAFLNKRSAQRAIRLAQVQAVEFGDGTSSFVLGMSSLIQALHDFATIHEPQARAQHGLNPIPIED